MQNVSTSNYLSNKHIFFLRCRFDRVALERLYVLDSLVKRVIVILLDIMYNVCVLSNY